MDRNLIFDVSSLLWWNRPATGIFRVCAEIFFWLKANDSRVRFIFFVPEIEQYYAIAPEIVMEHINQWGVNVIESKNEEKNFLKKTILYVKKKIKSKLKLIVKEQKSEIEAFSHYYWRLREKCKKEIMQSANKFEFNHKDLYLTLGVNWIFSQEKTLYNLKEIYKFKVFTICYDMIPVFFPQVCIGLDSAFFINYFKDLSQISDVVFCISLHTEKDYKNFLKLYCKSSNPKIALFYLGSNITTQLTKPNQLQKESPFLLFVSSFDIRKNHDVLYNAYIKLIEDGEDNLPYLVFVGSPGCHLESLMYKCTHDARINKKIIIMYNVSDEELAWLYQNCLFTLYPSLYEGWGLPIAESLNSGKFCIASSTSSMPEVGRQFIDYVHPLDVFTWAKKIQFYINNPRELFKKEKEIKKSYIPIKWEETIADLIEFIDSQYT